MIEQILERIACALETIAYGKDGLPPNKPEAQPTSDASGQEPPAPKKGKKKEPEASKEVTTDDIAAALRAFVTTNGKDKAVAILAKFKAARLSEIKAEDFAAVLAELKPKAA